MKKVILIILLVLSLFTSVFAKTYIMKISTYKRIENLSNRIFSIVETRYKGKQNTIYWTIVDTIDGYIVLHPKISEYKKLVLLCLKTFILKHMGYNKFSNSIKIMFVND